MKAFNPNAASPPGSGLFGLPHSLDEARVAVLPVPFDATSSYAKGAARGPAAIAAASRQVDLFDLQTGKPYEQGIALVEVPKPLRTLVEDWNREATRRAAPVIAAGGPGDDPRLLKAAEAVNRICGELNRFVFDHTSALIEAGKLVAVVGGDHGAPFGSIAAHARRYPGMGVLHVDAHADLREAFEGFAWSHASIMFNVVRELPGVARLVQVGVRDLCEEEWELIQASKGRIRTFTDTDLARERFAGATWAKQCQRIARSLPKDVYVSFDIDGLDPALCPHTGTPVPGGLSFQEACALLEAVVDSGRRIVGLDLDEVAPGPEGDEWDANVGARMLYKMIGWALRSGGAGRRPRRWARQRRGARGA
jgi:agmatinase